MKLRPFVLPNEEHQMRSRMHIAQGNKFLKSVNEYDFKKMENISVSAGKPKQILKNGEDPIERVTLFGVKGTIEKTGCILYATRCILYEYGIEISMCDWANEVAEKGYKRWMFSKYLKDIFFTGKVNFQEVKEHFKTVQGIESCQTIEDFTKILGEIIPSNGGSMFLFDNLIADLSKEKVTPVVETRLTTVEEVVVNLRNGIFVPARVNNTVYHNDINRIGGHHIIITGINYGMATIADSSIIGGINSIPAEQLFLSIVENPGYIAVWDLSKIQK